ncbi:hypothetical protein H7X46_17945 [Pseudonocardia sp. C8]|uniref:hypothetical protein n=1 Tax=Pseudonocardia sp. C8 TaxID=2762759 RepID=UPI00164335BC|nr:hypothetical protein [Pseudonocardia sp. C8]MBC3192944.1 hypothetical protein [Pseudonocardia sp. C8]
MGRHERNGEGVDDSAEELDLTSVSAAELRDRLAALSDGRDARVVGAAVELRRSLDRLGAGIAQRRTALVGRAGEIARAAAPFAGGAVAAGVGALLVVRRTRRPGPA